MAPAGRVRPLRTTEDVPQPEVRRREPMEPGLASHRNLKDTVTARSHRGHDARSKGSLRRNQRRY